ncbi:Putative ribosomal N-acetyltransferase YdaF [Kordia antarctica]|uniref:Ribosomal N-acetyltransferase YdaF n=1 Tax=Kordia antarctica TaxID=1218801 RepID=A0A7L4ZHJ5_9FLAO|nr:GNAT family N-acetyltransferase [Kordia antarctica]QHI35947.1 Putative ribosomal N-acetyltransferase YdaF [Kordia antarctica]
MNIDHLFNTSLQLETEKVVLRPVQRNDYEDFKTIIFEPDIWSFYTIKYENEQDLDGFFDSAMTDYKSRNRCAFSIIDKSTDTIVGSSSFGNISIRDARLEIGWSWLCKSARGKGINTHAKFLMLQYAFEILKAIRVEFKTDIKNLGARKALIKCGATEEGVLRSHTQMHSNRRRDTIFYSVLSHEWADIKQNIYSYIK